MFDVSGIPTFHSLLAVILLGHPACLVWGPWLPQTRAACPPPQFSAPKGLYEKISISMVTLILKAMEEGTCATFRIWVIGVELFEHIHCIINLSGRRA